MDAITISETDEHQSASSNDKRLHLALLVRIGMPILTKLASVIFGLERIPDLLSFAFKRESYNSKFNVTHISSLYYIRKQKGPLFIFVPNYPKSIGIFLRDHSSKGSFACQ